MSDGIWINVKFEESLVEILDGMIAAENAELASESFNEYKTDRSKFIRRLVRQEAARRAGMTNIVRIDELPSPAGGEQIPVVTIQVNKKEQDDAKP